MSLPHMTDHPPLLSKVLQWAQHEESIKAIILTGSHAAGSADPLSDYDLALFCTSFDSYTTNEAWLTEISNVWVCVNESIHQYGKQFPTRLVIFDGGLKADFAFYTLDILHALVQSQNLPADYNRGYEVVLDKDSLCTSLPKASGQEYPAQIPSQEEFLRIVKEFWFEVHHVAKYLKREDLWSVKFRMNGIQDNLLLKMIEWHEEANSNWERRVPPLGKRMHSWVEERTWRDLHHVFAHFDAKDSREALLKLIVLFRRLSVDASIKLGYPYPYAMDRHLTDFVDSLFTSI